MKHTAQQALCRAVLGASALVIAALPARATLKYQPGDYAAQDALVVHLDGIANAGVGKPHDPTAAQWANLADPANPAAITANASSGWRNDGYYFCWASSKPSHAQLVSAAPSMTQATFEFAVDAQAATQPTVNGSKAWASTIFSATNDQKVCFNDTAAANLVFKADQWTGGNNRPTVSAWGWKQASFTLASSGAGNFKSYDSGTFKTSASAGSTGVNTIPATRWMLATNIRQIDWGRQFVGVIRAFRIYNRALTAEEVAQNAAIDAARFEGMMPVTNAVVATSVVGANGNEVPGVYAVDGSHVFTAPASRTVSGTTYALTGCTVETWKNGAWGAPDVRDGVFAVEVSESEKVKITWNWAAATGTLTSYATDGLVVWLDGIWNAGKGVHNASATQWANLANPANNAAITANASSGWRDDGYYFCYDSASSYAQLANATPAMTRATFEFAFDGKLSDQSGFDWGSYFVSRGANNGICGLNTSGTLCLNATGWTGGTGNDYRPTIVGWGWKQASFSLGEAVSDGLRAYEGGTLKNTRARASVVEIPATRWYVANYSTAQKYQAVGTMKSVRIYNRALSPGEVAQNAAADAARFEGSAATAVEVVADPRGFSGREPAGMYFPEGWTFSSGVSTKTVGSVEYAPAGYVVETYDSTLSSWVVSERVLRNGDGAVEWTAPAAPYETYRLTWLWEPVSGIRRAADYTIADYAPGGMVVWYDGICNDGIGAAHVDSASHPWRELVSGEQANMGVNDNSHWTKDGYYFAVGPENEKSYFYLNTDKNKLKSLGTVGTMEIACDVKGSDQVGDWPCLLSFGHTNVAWAAHDNDMSIHTYKTDGSCRWKTDTWSGGGDRANITQPWDGKHAAFVMDTATFRSYRRGTVDQTRNRVTVKSMPPAFFFVGNKFYQNGKDNNNAYSQLVGTMKAVRAYNRVLSDAEIAHNYKVDVARFDGALAATNVVVAASDYNGALAADAYEVFGTHVFEGAASAVDGSMPNRVKVWTLENGAWILSETIDGPAYTYTAGTSPATVKIEFGKTNPFVLIVR